VGKAFPPCTSSPGTSIHSYAHSIPQRSTVHLRVFQKKQSSSACPAHCPPACRSEDALSTRMSPRRVPPVWKPREYHLKRRDRLIRASDKGCMSTGGRTVVGTLLAKTVDCYSSTSHLHLEWEGLHQDYRFSCSGRLSDGSSKQVDCD
jgi:hypothetical protein